MAHFAYTYYNEVMICFFLPSTVVSMNLWLLEVVFGLGVLLLVHILLKKIVRHIRQRSLTNPHNWKTDIDAIFLLPCQILLWILGLTLVAEMLVKHFGISFFGEYLGAFRATSALFCASWILMRWKSILQRHFLRKNKDKNVDVSFVHTVGNLITASIGILTGMIMMQIWGLNMGALIAFGGVGAAIIGFAAKDIIANFFGGLMLVINRPFVVGDLIEIQQHSIEGQVEAIGWYLTTLRNRDKRPVYLPNLLFAQIVVVNISRMTHRRLKEQIPLYHVEPSQLKDLCAKIRETLYAHPDVDTELPLIVSLSIEGKNDLRLDLDLYTLQTRYEDFHAFRQEILILALESLAKAGVLYMGQPMTIELKDRLPKAIYTGKLS